MAKSRSITIWSILALVVVLAGAGLTLISADMYLAKWIASGKKFELAQWHEINLNAGRCVIYFESKVGTPAATAIQMREPIEPGQDRGLMIYPERLVGEQSYHVGSFLVGRTFYRKIYEFNVLHSGLHRFQCSNVSVSADTEAPANDRIVFAKQPDSIDEVMAIRKTIHIIGATITFVLAMLLYIAHAVTLSRRNRALDSLSKDKEVEHHVTG